ncbi:MAG: lysophospholipid acyltransferase family protein [Phycisphaerales bacterium]
MSRVFEFARRVPGRSGLQILWFDLGRFLCELYVRLFHRLFVLGREHVPREGPAIFVSNHQSFLDPMINGAAVADRQLTPIARESLFRFRPFGWLIRSYGAIPIRDDSGDAGAMRAALSELAAGRCVLIYPEGSRSPDGSIGAFKRGVGLLIRRAKVAVVPMALDGASDVWPPGRRLPRLGGRVAVKVGPPIAPDDLLRDGPDAALDRLRGEIGALRNELRAEMLRRSGGRWPRAGGAM